MNKLRILSLGGGGFLVVASAWATLRYAGWTPFAWAALLGLVVAVVPSVMARAKLWARRGWRGLGRVRSDSPLRDATFVSESPVDDPSVELDAIADSVRDADGFDAVRHEQFDNGDGLVVTHAGFHSSFVRLTRGGRLAVSGASRRTRNLVDVIEATRPLSLSDRANNPLRRPDPVRGAPRVFLSIFLVGLLLVGVGGIANGAYPAQAYTSGEKTILVSIDARADFVPGVTATDATLSKADFVVGALEEESVEVQWESNSTTRLVEHGRQSLQMSTDVRGLLADARAGSLTDEQAARADHIERDLHAAEADTAEALTKRVEEGGLIGEKTELVSVRDDLRSAADQPV